MTLRTHHDHRDYIGQRKGIALSQWYDGHMFGNTRAAAHSSISCLESRVDTSMQAELPFGSVLVVLATNVDTGRAAYLGQCTQGHFRDNMKLCSSSYLRFIRYLPRYPSLAYGPEAS